MGLEPKYEFIFNSDGTDFEIYPACHFCCLLNNIFLKLIFLGTNSLIPFTVIISCNIIIIVKLAKTRKLRRVMSTNTQIQCQEFNSLTKTLPSVSFAYLLLTFPYVSFAMLFPYTAHLYSSYDEYFCGRRLWFVCVQSMGCFNFSINFILYCLGGTRFRNAFLTMIGFKRVNVSQIAPHQIVKSSASNC